MYSIELIRSKKGEEGAGAVFGWQKFLEYALILGGMLLIIVIIIAALKSGRSGSEGFFVEIGNMFRLL
jgi:hypothetical protein